LRLQERRHNLGFKVHRPDSFTRRGKKRRILTWRATANSENKKRKKRVKDGTSVQNVVVSLTCDHYKCAVGTNRQQFFGLVIIVTLSNETDKIKPSGRIVNDKTFESRIIRIHFFLTTCHFTSGFIIFLPAWRGTSPMPKARAKKERLLHCHNL